MEHSHPKSNPKIKPNLIGNTPFIITFSFLALAIVAGVGAFFYQQLRIDQLEPKAATESTTKNQPTAITPETPQSDQSTPGQDQNRPIPAPSDLGQYITVPEWGIKIKTLKELKHYSYTVINGAKNRNMYFIAAPADIPNDAISCLVNPDQNFPHLHSQFILSAYDQEQVKNIPNPWPSGGRKVFQNQKYTFFIFHPQAVYCTNASAHEATAVKLLEKMLKENISNL